MRVYRVFGRLQTTWYVVVLTRPSVGWAVTIGRVAAAPKSPGEAVVRRRSPPNRLQLPRRTHRPQRHTTGRGWHKPPFPFSSRKRLLPHRHIGVAGGRGLVQGPGLKGTPGPLRPSSPARSYPRRLVKGTPGRRLGMGTPAVRAGVRDGSYKAWSPEDSHTSTARELRPPAHTQARVLRPCTGVWEALRGRRFTTSHEDEPYTDTVKNQLKHPPKNPTHPRQEAPPLEHQSPAGGLPPPVWGWVLRGPDLPGKPWWMKPWWLLLPGALKKPRLRLRGRGVNGRLAPRQGMASEGVGLCSLISAGVRSTP